MKLSKAIFLSFLLFTSIGFAQEPIELPDAPLFAKAQVKATIYKHRITITPDSTSQETIHVCTRSFQFDVLDFRKPAKTEVSHQVVCETAQLSVQGAVAIVALHPDEPAQEILAMSGYLFSKKNNLFQSGSSSTMSRNIYAKDFAFQVSASESNMPQENDVSFYTATVEVEVQ